MCTQIYEEQRYRYTYISFPYIFFSGPRLIS